MCYYTDSYLKRIYPAQSVGNGAKLVNKTFPSSVSITAEPNDLLLI
jgi:hypothetical protein